ncbi:hypothetical protein MMC13_001858, partial [Lambiella insularis]|nr:hypothetical protein [Lambiella insularis]
MAQMTGMVREDRLSWYREWMEGDASMPVTMRRRSELAGLLDAIQNHRYDSQTLQEITLILDHECLCWKYHDGKDKSSESSGLLGRRQDVLNCTLESSRTVELVTQLASCLVRSISASTHYERELQSKALLAALALLDAHGVRALQADFHDRLRTQLNNLSRDLDSVPGELGSEVSVEIYRRVQCSYFLCLAAEYRRRFELARPFSLSILSSAASFIVFGVTVASAALGSPPGGLPPAVTDLTRGLHKLQEALRPLWIPQNDLLQDLCSLQELTRIAAAHAFHHQVTAQSDESKSMNGAHTLAILVLEKIQSIFSQNRDWVITVQRQSRYHDFVQLLFNRGPSGLGRYFYYYGLLDCASQLSSILPGALSMQFRQEMNVIIMTSHEPSFRWKALEVLIRNCEADVLRLPMIPDHFVCSDFQIPAETRDRIHAEAKIIWDAIGEEYGFVSPRTSIASLSSTPALDTMSLKGWLEIPLVSPKISPDAHKLSIKSIHKLRAQFSGLSPEAEHVYYMSSGLVVVYSLGVLATGLNAALVLSRPAVKSIYHKAALSEKFLVVLKECEKGHVDSLEVVKYGPGFQAGRLLGSETFEPRSNEPRWHPNCLAIHENGSRVWVAVGGRTNQGGVMCGSIKMYKVNTTSANTKMLRHDADFSRPRPNLLKGDFLKTIAFDKKAERLVATTNTNTIL